MVLGCLLFISFAFASVETPEDRILAKGFSAYMDGKDKIALSYFEEVLRINPNNSSARRGVDKVKVRLKKAQSVEEKKSKKLAKAKVEEGKEFMKTNDLVSAIDSFHAAVDAVPEYKSAEAQLKKIKRKTEKVLKKKKFNLTSWAYSRGILAYLDRDWAKAFRIWSERSSIEPQILQLASAKTRAENKFVKMMAEERVEFLRRGAREFYRQGMYVESKQGWERVLVMVQEDQEALEGKARSENAILRIQGKDQNKREHDLLERGLEYFASQDWVKARTAFRQLVQLDPNFNSAKEYLAKINRKLTSPEYVPIQVATKETLKPYREARPSNPGGPKVVMPSSLENMDERRAQLESQLNRNPNDIQIQQELDKMKKLQNEESERIYKDGLIAYSQGNRQAAIDKWKQVLVLNPDHKKASAALRKAKAEEERTTP